MDLSERLKAIADFVKKNSIVGDIGTDHGYIPIYLIEEGISKRVIASDISRGSLEKAVENVEHAGLKDKIFCRLGNGLDTIKPYEIDTVIISGMGGILIKEILDSRKDVRDSINNFILQANIATDELRRYLIENGFEIVDEVLVKDSDKYYEIIQARKGVNPEYDFYKIGDKLIENRDPLLREFIEHKLKLNQAIIEDLLERPVDSVKDRIDFLEDENRKYKEVLVKIES